MPTIQPSPPPSSAKALVSVVIPAYNSAAFITDAITSVQRQTCPGVEIIVVDDGSTDDTAAVVAGFGAAVRLIRQSNQGSGAARNTGIAAAGGRYVAFLDADDVWHADKLQIQLQVLQSTGHRMAYSRFIWWRPQADGQHAAAQSVFANPTPGDLSQAATPDGWLYAELLRDCIVWTSTVLIERDLLNCTGGFDADLRKGQDWELWLRLSQLEQWAGVPQALALYRTHDANITRKATSVNYEYRILTRAVAQWGLTGPDGSATDAAFIRSRLGRSCLNFGLLHLGSGDPRIARHQFGLSMRHTGVKPRALAWWLVAAGKSLLVRQQGATG